MASKKLADGVKVYIFTEVLTAKATFIRTFLSMNIELFKEALTGRLYVNNPT